MAFAGINNINRAVDQKKRFEDKVWSKNPPKKRRKKGKKHGPK